jgi:hypothetical protein
MSETGVLNAIPHDIRRTAITRWEALDIPRVIVIAASGHKPINVHEGYINFCDEQLTNAFAELMLLPAKRPRHLPRRGTSVRDLLKWL